MLGCNEPKLVSRANQFGSAKNVAVVKLFMFTSAVKYFTEKDINAHFCALDAFKACDHINHYVCCHA